MKSTKRAKEFLDTLCKVVQMADMLDEDEKELVSLYCESVIANDKFKAKLKEFCD